MKNDNLTATTVKIENELYCDFKNLTSRKKITLQKFVDACVHLYTENTIFRDMVNTFTIAPRLSTSGSFNLSI